MTNPKIYKEIEKVVKEIDSEVQSANDDELEAEEIVSSLVKSGGGIEVLSDTFRPCFDDVSDVQDRVSDVYPKSYGIDGSTTKDLGFNNGLTISIAVAAASTVGTDNISNISKKGTVSVSAYFEKEDIDVEPESTEDTKVFFHQFPRLTRLTSDLPQWLNSIARTDAEGKHFEWVSSSTEGPLFIDGPILPPELLIWISYDQVGRPEGTPMEDWDSMIIEIFQSYINGIEECVESGYPVYGVQKSTTATRVIDAILEKDETLDRREIPYTNDGTLFNSVLTNRDKSSVVAYTPWYVEDEFHIGSGMGRVTPLKRYDRINLSLGSYEDYKRAFFFAKPPTETTVYRIGVPKLVFQFKDKRTVRDVALSEMIKQFSEPLPVVVADEKVRIPRGLRDKFRNLISSSSHKGKNEQRGYKK